MTSSLNNELIKCERLIYIQTSMNAEVYLSMIRVLTGSQEIKVLEVSL